MDLRLELPGSSQEAAGQNVDDAAPPPTTATSLPLKLMVDMFELVTNAVLSSSFEPPQSIAITIQSTQITLAGLEAFAKLCRSIHVLDRAAVQRVAVRYRALTVQLVALMDFFQLKASYRHAMNLMDYGMSLMLCSNDFFLRIMIQQALAATEGTDDMFVGPDTSISFDVYVDRGLYRSAIVKFQGLVAPDDDDDNISQYYRRDRSVDMSTDVFFEFSQHLCTAVMDIIRFTVQANNPGKELYSRMIQFVVQNRRILFFTLNAKAFLDLLPGCNDYTRAFIERTLNYPAILAPTSTRAIEGLHARVADLVFEPESPDDGKPLLKFFLKESTPMENEF